MSSWDLSQYQLDRPMVLWAVVVVVLFFLLREHGTVGWARARLFITTLVRCFAFLALVLALAGPHRFEEHPDLSLVFVVDGSGSSSGGRMEVYRERLREWWERKGDVPARIVVASDDLTRVADPDEMDAALPAVNEATPTDLGPAVELAVESFEPTSSRALLLFSDGVVTEGQVDRAAAVAGVRGVRIFPVPPDEGKLSVAARRLELGNALVKQGEEISATVVVDANGPAVVDVTLLDARDRVVATRAGIEIDVGETPVLLGFRIETPGVYPLRAEVAVEGDLFDLDDVAYGAIEVVGPPSVLVAGESAATRRFGKVLSGMRPPMAYETTGPSANQPLDDTDLLVWLDPALGDVSQDKATDLRSFVRRGGRLLMVGGPQGLAVADEGQDELKDLLPVKFPKTEKKEAAPLAVVYCIDRSDSMGRAAKFEIALTAVAESIAMLEPTSRVGVVTFSDLPHWAVPMTTADDLDAIKRRLSELTVHGGTSIYPALQMGYEALIDEEAKLKHMLLLTDGKSVSTLKRDGEVVHNVAKRDFTLSTVAIGRESDQEELSAVASIGQGRFYYTDDFGSIPQIFLEETMTVVRTNKIEQQFEVHAVDESRFLEGVDTDTIPDLEGYIRSLQKTTSELALATERGEPVLVSWRHGRGIVTLFTSDFGGEWSTAWADWDQRHTLWRTVVRETLTPQPAPEVSLSGEIVGDELRLEYSILDALKNPRNNLVVEGVVTTPGGLRSTVDLQPSGPGRYAASVDANEVGGYLASVAPVGRREGALDASGGSIPGGAVQRSIGTVPPRETRAGTLNIPLLQRLADETGGLLEPDFAQVLEDGVDTRRIRVDSWERLLWAALILFIADIAVRRLRIPRFLRRGR